MKRLETPAVYNISTDELYELDEPALEFLKKCGSKSGFDNSEGNSDFIAYALKEGILSTEQTDVKRPPFKKTSEPSLRYLELQITRKCNLQCRHCYIGPPENMELSLEKVKSILLEFERMQGLRLLITGGEPLLHKKFKELNALLPAFAFRKILFTNGTLLTREALKRLNVDELQISVDGLEEGHEALRGKGTFRRTIGAIHMALEAGFAVSISTMIHSKNLQDFEEMERLFRSLGIRDWAVDAPCAEGNLKDNVSFHVRPETAGKFLNYGFGEGLHGGGENFACGLHLAAVMADGKVAKCAFYKDAPVGHIDEGLEACWRKITPLRLKDLQCDCEFIETCRGGCRYRAELLGSKLGIDSYRCSAYHE